MKRLLIFALVCGVLSITISPFAQQPDRDTQIAECQSADDVDVCLSDVAFSLGDASICNAANDPTRCRQAMSDTVVLLCQDQSNSQACFGTWGEQGVETACTYLPVDEQPTCFVMAAVQSRDFSIINRHIPAGEARDQARIIVAVFTSAPDALDDIDDNRLYDNAYIYMIPIMSIGQGVVLPDDYCSGLRGNYGGEYPEDAQINAEVCADTLAVVRAFREADESEQDAILEDMLEAFEEGGEEAALRVLRDSLVSDPLAEAFIRGWCRADDAGICVGAVPIMEYNPDTDTIVHFVSGPPRFYENIEEGLYRMYYDAEITEDGETRIVSWYGEIIIESPERFYWRFYNHLGNAVNPGSYYVPLPAQDEDVAD